MRAGELKQLLADMPDDVEVAAVCYDDVLADRQQVTDAYRAKGILDDEFIDIFIIGYVR